MSTLTATPFTPPPFPNRDVLLAHHWMELFRGGEAVLEQFGLLFPDADIALLTYSAEHLPPDLKRRVYHTSSVHRMARVRHHFRKLLPFFPEIIRTIKVPKETRFVLSSDASLIKGIKLPEGAEHACYCHSPPRYLWGMEDAYLDSASHKAFFSRMLFSACIPRLRRYDARMAERVDHFIANSECVRDRIKRCYGRDSTVIHPPVQVDAFDHTRPREDFYLVVSALVPYKRVDLAVQACTRLGRKLVVIGTGSEEAYLRSIAGPTVQFLGWQSRAAVQDHFERCRAFLFPGIEDFGITPCEAQAAGAPVLAFNEGGALETVVEGVSGLFFTEQSAENLAATLERFESLGGFSAEACRQNVHRFRPSRFRREIREFLLKEFPHRFQTHRWPVLTAEPS